MATQTGSLDLSAVKQAFIKTVAKAQPIYKRTNANSAPNPPTSKITATTDQGTSGNWTTMHMARLCSTNFAYKYLWTCNQLLAQDGTFLGTTEVVADNGTTVINGDEIATGTIAAERLNIADTITAINNNGTTTINGGKITTGTISAGAIDATSGTFNTANIPNLSADKITTGTIQIGRIPSGALNSELSSSITNAGMTANSYINDIDSKSGITIKAVNGTIDNNATTGNYLKLNPTDGLNIYKGGVSVAQYGDTARVGKDTSRNVYIDGDSVNIRNVQTVLSKFTAEGAELGKNSDTATVKMCDGALEIKGSYRTSSSSNDTYISTIRNNKTSALKELMLQNGNVDATLFDGGQTFGRSFSMTVSGGTPVEVMGSVSDDFGVVSLQAGEAYLDVRSGSDGDDGSITVPHVLINGRLSVPNYRIQNMYAYNHTVSYATNMYIGTTGLFSRTTNTSSERYKHDIKDVVDETLNPHKLYDIEVKQFKYNEDVLTDKEDPRYGATLIGFISEQVKECYPIAVDVNEEGECEAWNYQYLIPPMLKLIQEQHEQIDSLTKRIEALERNNK